MRMSVDYSAAYASVVENLLKGNLDSAAQTLGEIPSWLPPTDAQLTARNVSMSAQVAVFRRDNYTCRYCDRHVVIPPVLRLLSISLGNVFPYHPHGKMSECHLAFWRDIASCDHLIPVAQRGSSKGDNLVTSCYMCNSVKQSWTVEELRWPILDVSENEPWDGLSSRFPTLLENSAARFEEARIPYFRDWLHAIQSKAAVAQPIIVARH